MRLQISVLFLCAINLAFGWTKSGTTYTTTGTQADLISAIADSTAGDTVAIPSGTFSNYGVGATQIDINKAITVKGSGSTIINLSATGWTSTSGTFNISAAGVVVRDLTINGIANTTHPGSGTTAISIYNVNGWRVTNITWNSSADPGYFAFVSNAYGLFDHCPLGINHGSQQTFMVRGGANVWTSANTMGTANAVYIEDCTTSGGGYIVEGDGSAQVVVRFNAIAGASVVDSHQIDTSTDALGAYHGGRQMECYNNTWTYTAAYTWAAMDMKGGTGMLFDNTASTAPWLQLTAYGASGHFWNSGYTVQDGAGPAYVTPAQIPFKDYIGVGIPPIALGKEPMYLWNNIQNTTGAYGGLGSSVDWNLTAVAPEAGAYTQYGATFYMNDGPGGGTPAMLNNDVDFYKGTVGGSFNGSSGVGRGTKATMNAINMTGKTKKVGFWVTDEGSWRAGHSGTSGQLYQWNGSAWVLYYTPYTYPHPLQAGGGGDTTAPTPNPSTIASTSHTSTSVSVTATTATDETALATAPYRFSNDNGSTYTSFQTSATYNWSGLTPATAYLVKVQAQDAAGNVTTASSATTVTTDAASGGTGIPASRPASGKKASSVNLTEGF